MALEAVGSLNTYHSLVSAFTEFLTVAIHLILYERNIYPRGSFLRTRKYDLPVQQNRHPKVCKWIEDAVSAVDDEMLKCTVRQTSLVLYSPDSIPLERYVFSTELFPVVEEVDILVPFSLEGLEPPPSLPSHDSRSTTPTPVAHHPTPSMLDLTAQFAAVLSRISTQIPRLGPLPDGCSFTIAIELRESSAGRLPADSQATWLPAEPGLQPLLKMEKIRTPERAANDGYAEPRRQVRGKDLGGAQTLSVRTVETGAFIMEVWIEEGKDKQSLHDKGVSKRVHVGQANE